MENDTFGFREGDELIKETSTIISDIIRTPVNEPSFEGRNEYVNIQTSIMATRWFIIKNLVVLGHYKVFYYTNFF
jgi:hypothetical protein